jgi:hypothetical protein
VAIAHNVPLIGTLGVVLGSKKNRHVENARPLLKELIVGHVSARRARRSHPGEHRGEGRWTPSSMTSIVIQGNRQRNQRGVHAGATKRFADVLHVERPSVHRDRD